MSEEQSDNQAAPQVDLSEKALKTLCKVTGLPHGLFNETSKKVRGGLTQIVFDSPAESDEYEVLIDPKHKVIQIKNAYTTWEREIIDALVKEADAPPRPAVGVGGQPQAITPVTMQTTLPPQIAVSLNVDIFAQYIADFIKINPTVVMQHYDPADFTAADETLLTNPLVWTFTSMSAAVDPSTSLDEYMVEFIVVGSGTNADQALSGYLDIDKATLAIKKVYFEI